MAQRVSIRPGVSILSVLRHLNYKPWYAIAEFVDNSLQSYLDNQQELQDAPNSSGKLSVNIELDEDGRRITIRDNAAGIHESDYARAFRPAEIPPNRAGLAEFGMGLKSASCWFAPRWSVRTTALGESVERTVAFDIDRIVRDELEELDVQSVSAPPNAHYTEIVLVDVFRPLRGRTIGKIKDHLGSIYRVFIRQQILTLTFDTDTIDYVDPPVLTAPYYREPAGEARRWYKPINLDFGMDQRMHGFAALRERGSTAEAGFALFRRDRLIQGSRDEAYRPAYIFGASNSFAYQRLFGELHLEGFEVSHTKDGFQWEEHEDIVLELLKKQLDEQPIPLLGQAEGYRSRIRTEDVRTGSEIALHRTGEVIEREVPEVLEQQLVDPPEPASTPPELPPAAFASRRTVDVDLEGARWQIALELSTDPGVGDWVFLSEQPTAAAVDSDAVVRRLGVRVALAHPFMERFGGSEPSQIEPLLRVAVALVLAEVTAREAGVALAGAIRRRVNQLLREALSKP
jgi:hypothetical protein